MITRNDIIGLEDKYVGLLTIEEKDSLIGVLYDEDSYFNPIQDYNQPPNWIISIEEIDYNVNQDFMWVKELPLILWVGPPEPTPGPTGPTGGTGSEI